MIERRKSRVITAGNVKIGGDNPISVQSMLNVIAEDAEGNVTGMSTTAVKDAVGKTVNYCNRITYIPSDDNGVATGAATVVYVNYAITIAD